MANKRSSTKSATTNLKEMGENVIESVKSVLPMNIGVGASRSRRTTRSKTAKTPVARKKASVSARGRKNKRTSVAGRGKSVTSAVRGRKATASRARRRAA